MGEGLPTMMERVERVFSAYNSTHLERNVARAIVEQVWVSTRGFSSMPVFLAALMTFVIIASKMTMSPDLAYVEVSAEVINSPKSITDAKYSCWAILSAMAPAWINTGL